MWLNEDDCEKRLRGIIIEKIIPTYPDIQMLTSKDVIDIIICRNNCIPKLFFLEVKLYKPANGRLGIGKGVSFQTEILSTRPQYFENNMRWIIFNEFSDNAFYVLTNEDCCKYSAGDSVRYDKTNNFQLKLFNEVTPLSEQELIKWLVEWINT